jgi:hypothetical protein
MIDVSLEQLVDLVGSAVRFDLPWDKDGVASELAELGWKPYGSIAFPHSTRMVKDDIRLAADVLGDVVFIGGTLKEWQPDWSASSDYVKSVADNYESQIQDCRMLAEQFIPMLAERFEVEPEGFILDRDDFSFVHVDCWKVAHVHLIVGLEHLDPADTPILISIYLLA